MPGESDVVRLVDGWSALGCLARGCVGAGAGAGGVFFVGDVVHCPALGRGKRTGCVWRENGWGGSLIEKAEKP